MKTKDVIEGLTILAKYRDTQDGYDIGAEHDVIYAHETNKPVEADDLKRLVELGWFQDDAEFEDDFRPEDYDPALLWAAFV